MTDKKTDTSKASEPKDPSAALAKRVKTLEERLDAMVERFGGILGTNVEG